VGGNKISDMLVCPLLLLFFGMPTFIPAVSKFKPNSLPEAFFAGYFLYQFSFINNETLLWWRLGAGMA